jgi:hypothetical protein
MWLSSRRLLLLHDGFVLSLRIPVLDSIISLSFSLFFCCCKEETICAWFFQCASSVVPSPFSCYCLFRFVYLIECFSCHWSLLHTQWRDRIVACHVVYSFNWPFKFATLFFRGTTTTTMGLGVVRYVVVLLALPLHDDVLGSQPAGVS